MHFQTPLLTLLPLLTLTTSILARPADQQVSGDEVTNTQCTDETAQLDSHDTNVAILSICGSIAGDIEKCEGSPTETEGESGTSKFTLNTTEDGATINISKGRWERCVKAAQITCPTGTFTSTCIGGATEGDVDFALDEA